VNDKTKADLRRHIDESRQVGASVLYYAKMNLDEFEGFVRDTLSGTQIEAINGNQTVSAEKWEAIVTKITGRAGGCLLVKVPEGSRLSKGLSPRVVGLQRKLESASNKKTTIMIAASSPHFLDDTIVSMFLTCPIE
jgi:hypothetical protein